jgi:transcriptional regulator with XRE-family HTH domain
MTFVGLGNGMVLPNATSGMLSVRPHLAGTASGLGGAIMVGGGAALSALAGIMLTGGNGAYPLIWIMLVDLGPCRPVDPLHHPPRTCRSKAEACARVCKASRLPCKPHRRRHAPAKLYAGAKLREIRTRLGLTQKDFAAKLGVSLPYLNQMENNNRPVSTAVVLGLAQEFGIDVTELRAGDAERLVSDMREALADPVFADGAPPLGRSAAGRVERARTGARLSRPAPRLPPDP